MTPRLINASSLSRGGAAAAPFAGLLTEAEVQAIKPLRYSRKVLDPSIKGETDRFAYRFVKP